MSHVTEVAKTIAGVQEVFSAPEGGSSARSPIRSSDLGFRFLLILIVVIYIAPQNLVSVLEPLHLALISCILAVVASGKTIIVHCRRLVALNQEVKGIAWLVVLALLSIPFSKWPGGSWESFGAIYSKSVIVFTLIATILTSFERFHQLFWVISVCSAFNAGMAIRRYMAGDYYSHDRILGGASGIASNPNDLALLLNLTIPFVVYLVVTGKTKIEKWTAAGILVLAIAGIFVTYSRGGFITLVVLLLWSTYMRSKRKRAGSFIGALLILSLVFVSIFAFAPSGYIERLSSTIDIAKDKQGSAQTRLGLIIGTAQAILEHPLGVGLNMHHLALQEQGLGWIAVHNVYLQLTADLGIIAGVLFMAVFLKLLASMRRIRASQAPNDLHFVRLAEAVEAALLAFAVAAMFHPVAYHFYFYIIAGLAVALKELTRHQMEGATMLSAEKRPVAIGRVGW